MGSRAKNREIKWGCSNRISNGRAACDSHHVNEETLQRTYTAAVQEMIADAEEVIRLVQDSTGLVMEPENTAELARVEQEIIELQEAVMEIHKAKQKRGIGAAEYAEKIREHSQRMQELEARQEELQTTENRYNQIKVWLDNFARHIQSGEIMNSEDSQIMKQLVEQIIVGADSMEIQFKCGVIVKQKYVK